MLASRLWATWESSLGAGFRLAKCFTPAGASSAWPCQPRHCAAAEAVTVGSRAQPAARAATLSMSAVPQSNMQAPACEPVVDHATVLPGSSERQASVIGGFSTGVTTVPTGQGFKKTFYKRTLPTPPAVAFASPEGRQLFAEALAAGHMNGFFKLMEQFSTQDEPAFCGLASLSMVLNALAIDPRRTWKGAWRWFHEQMLDCCRPLEDVKREGITLPQAACLSRCNGARVVLHRHGTFTLGQLREQVLEVCSSGEQHLVVSYSRRTFLQTGDGHFSPIGGYHAATDRVLILDVARFKYPPHWVPLPMLYDAMHYLDPVTNQPRGFLRISAQPLLTSVLLTLDVRSSCWQRASDWVRNTAPAQLQAAATAPTAPPAEQLTAALLSQLPTASLDAFLMLRDNLLTPGGTTVKPTDTGSDPSVSLVSDGVSAASEATINTAGNAIATASGGPSRRVASVWDVPLQPGARAGSPSREVAERCLPVGARQQLLVELRALPLFTMVQRVMQRSGQLQECTQLTCEHSSSAAATASGPIEPHTTAQDLGTAPLAFQSGAIDINAGQGIPFPGTPGDMQGVQGSLGQGFDVQGMQGAVQGSPRGENSIAQAGTPAVGALNQQGSCCGTHKAQASTPSGGCCQPPRDHQHLQSPDLVAEAGVRQATSHGASPAVTGRVAASRQHPLNSGYLAEKATVLLLLYHREGAWPREWADMQAGKEWATLMDTSGMSIVEAELAYLREQWTHIDEVVQSGSVESQCSGGCAQKLDCAALNCDGT